MLNKMHLTVIIEQIKTKNINNMNPPKISKRLGIIILVTLILASSAVIAYKFYTDTVFCTEETLASKPDAIMFGASWCPYCFQARRYFINKNINFCEYDIEDAGKGEALYQRIIEHGMAQGIPVIFIGDYQLSGFNERHIKQILIEQQKL